MELLVSFHSVYFDDGLLHSVSPTLRIVEYLFISILMYSVKGQLLLFTPYHKNITKEGIPVPGEPIFTGFA